MSECRRKQQDLQLFTSCILVLSAYSRTALCDIEAFLNYGSYDFHQMRHLNVLRRKLAAYASIADHYRAPTARGEQQP